MGVKQRLNRLEQSIGWGGGSEMICIKYKNTADGRKKALNYIEKLRKQVKIKVTIEIPNNGREFYLKEDEEMLRVVIES